MMGPLGLLNLLTTQTPLQASFTFSSTTLQGQHSANSSTNRLSCTTNASRHKSPFPPNLSFNAHAATVSATTSTNAIARPMPESATTADPISTTPTNTSTNANNNILAQLAIVHHDASSVATHANPPLNIPDTLPSTQTAL